jgi:hypothetical protein
MKEPKPQRINMADPDFEPTDEQLQQLAHEAFAHVASENQARIAAMRKRIAKAQGELYRQLTVTQPTGQD